MKVSKLEEQDNNISEDIEAKRIAKIIFDKPSTEDAFDSAGHKRSASILADTIYQLRNRDGAIGLEGNWGSGKSTVINLSEKALTDINDDHIDYKLFPFDLWGHQSDDFRRAFLEEFIAWLKKERLLTQKQSIEAENKIRDKEKTVRQDKFKEYNIFGLGFLLVAPLIPVAYTWLSPFAFRAENPPEIAGLTITNLAFWFFVSLYFLFVLRLARHLDAPQKNKGFLNACSKAVSMFSEDIEEETTTQHIREKDPTTVEFHKIFREYLGLAQASKTRIVIVLDNIDRLPQEFILEIWSEVRSLFSVGSKSYENDFVTAVIPYDRGFIAKVFTDNSKNEDSECDIFSKTFDRIIKVSPPVLTDWRSFLDNLFDSYFEPNLSSQEKYRLFKLLKYNFEQNKTHPTPRSIIDYVNKIGSLWSVWGHAISVESMAVYTFYDSKIEENPEALQNVDLIDSRYIRIGSIKNWQKDFASLSLNVEPEKAEQAHLSQPISRALVAYDSDELQELSKSTGFEEVLTDVLQDNIKDWASEDSALIANAANNLSALELPTEVSESAWKELSLCFDDISKLDSDDLDTITGICKIITHQDENLLKSAQTLRSKIFESYDKESDTQLADGIDWIQAVGEVAKAIKAKNPKLVPAFLTQTRIPQNADFTVGAAYGSRSLIGVVDFKSLKPMSPMADIKDSLNNLITTSPDHFEKAYTALNKRLSEEDKNRFIQTIAGRLRTNDLEFKDIETLMEKLAKLYVDANSNGEAHNVLNSLLQDGTLAWHGNTASEEGYVNIESYAIWLTYEAIDGTNIPNISDQNGVFGNLNAAKNWLTSIATQAEYEPELIAKMADVVASTKSFSEWSKYAINEGGEYGFFKGVFVELVKAGRYNNLNVKQAVENYPKIKDIFEKEIAEKYLKKFTEWSQFFDKNFNNEEAIFSLPPIFIKDIGQLGVNQYDIILNSLDSHLKNIRDEDWKTAFEEEHDVIDLLIIRQKEKGINIPVNNIRPALLDIANRTLKGELFLKKYNSEWKNVIETIQAPSKKVLAKDILASIKEIVTTKAGIERFIEMYGDALDDMPYTDNPDVSLDQIFSKLISTTDQKSRDYIKNHEKVLLDCLNKASESSRKGFEEALEGIEEDEEMVNEGWTEYLRKITGLKKKKPIPANDESSDEGIDAAE